MSNDQKTMAEKEAQDTATRNRIITHMNNDHHDSIIRYLQHYHNLTSWTAYPGTLTSISLASMTITGANNQSYQIPFTPPLNSYRETRERVVEMDETCRKALGQSDITIQTFAAPTGLYSIPFLVIATTFLAYSHRSWFAKGALVEQLLGSRFAEFSWTIQPYLIAGMLLIHGTELAFFIPKYLLHHSVNPRTSTFWLWVATTFVEGQFAFIRFKKLVEWKREEKRRQKH